MMMREPPAIMSSRPPSPVKRGAIGVVWALLALVGCGPDQRVEARAALVAQQPDQARQAINKLYKHQLAEDDEGAARLAASRHLLLWRLERAAIEYAIGDPAAAIVHLNEASRLAREARTRSAARAVSAAVVNDNLTRWSGEAPELLRIPAYGLLAHLELLQRTNGTVPGAIDHSAANLHADRAASAALALADQLGRLADEEFGSARYRDDAWLHLLAATGLFAVAATNDDQQTARLFAERAVQAYAHEGPTPAVAARLIARILGEDPLPADHGSILLLEDAGWAPLRQALGITIVTAAPGGGRGIDIGGVWIVVDGPGRDHVDHLTGLLLPGWLIRDITRGRFGVFGCEIPVVPPLGVRNRLGSVTGSASLEPVDDIAGKIHRSFMDGQRRRVAAVIVRTAGKLIAARQGVHAIESSSSRNAAEREALGSLLWLLFSGLVRVSEQADTRCWSLLPGRTGAVLLDVPAGDHTLTVHRGDGAIETIGGIHVQPGQLVVLTVRSFPNGTGVPEQR